MKQTIAGVLAATILLTLLVAGSFAQSPQNPFHSVVLISWDGSHPEIVKEMLLAGQLPTLASLLTTGGQWHDLIFTDQLPTFPTVTKPGHSQMLTGQPWQVTGVKSNKEWAVIPLGLTLAEQWNASGAWVGWVVSKTNLNAISSRRPGPFANVWAIADCARFRNNEDQQPSALAAIACLPADLSQRFFLFWHLAYPDHAGHLFGAGSPEYRNSLVQNDQATQLVLNALHAGTQVVITTDHGFGKAPGGLCPPNAGAGHLKCPDIWAVSFPAIPSLGTRLMDVPIPLRP